MTSDLVYVLRCDTGLLFTCCNSWYVAIVLLCYCWCWVDYPDEIKCRQCKHLGTQFFLCNRRWLMILLSLLNYLRALACDPGWPDWLTALLVTFRSCFLSCQRRRRGGGGGVWRMSWRRRRTSREKKLYQSSTCRDRKRSPTFWYKHTHYCRHASVVSVILQLPTGGALRYKTDSS